MAKFGELIAGKIPVLLVFFRETDDERLLPSLKKVATAAASKAKIIKITIEKNAALADVLRINSSPAYLLYKNSEMQWRQSGFQEKEILIKELKKFF